MAWSHYSKETRVYSLGSKREGPSAWQGSKRGGARRKHLQGGGVGGPRRGESEDAKGADRRVCNGGGSSTVEGLLGGPEEGEGSRRDVMLGPKRAERRSELS